MARNMSFFMTQPQIKARTKTVTRRFGWSALKPGDVINAVEKGQGLKAGEKINRLCQIRILSVRAEPLNAITQADCILEGFPDFAPDDFVAMLVRHYRCDPAQRCNRIEFEYID
ncbi:MAG: ASCH domain-containing protein [Sulfitobacter sp.]|jgi:hypothetical protein